MPIPFLLAGAAVAAGAIGALGHKEAKETNERAERMCNDAQELYENSKRSLELSKNEMEKSLLKLGNTKKKTLDSSMSQFIESYGRVKDIEFEESIGLNEISNLRISSQDIVELVNMSNIYDSTIKSGAAGAATGAIITLAASGSLPIITSTLGAAGTALAIGEVGMAASLAGSAISLGAAMTPLTAIAAPVVMFTGISASIKADENLEKARAMYSQATAASEEMKISQTLCESISERSYMFDALLIELDKIFSGCTALLDGVTRRKMGIFKNKKVSYNDLTLEEKKLLMVTGSLAKAVKTIIDTPMLNEDGNLSFKLERVYNDIKKQLPGFIDNGEEVKSIDYGIKAKSYMNKRTKVKGDSNSNEEGLNGKSAVKCVFAIIATIIMYNITDGFIGALLFIPEVIVCAISILVIYAVLGEMILPKSFFGETEQLSARTTIGICVISIILSIFALKVSHESVINIIRIPCISTILLFGGIALLRLPEILKK